MVIPLQPGRIPGGICMGRSGQHSNSPQIGFIRTRTSPVDSQLGPGPHLPRHIPYGPQAGFVRARAGSLGYPGRAPLTMGWQWVCQSGAQVGFERASQNLCKSHWPIVTRGKNPCGILMGSLSQWVRPPQAWPAWIVPHYRLINVYLLLWKMSKMWGFHSI